MAQKASTGTPVLMQPNNVVEQVIRVMREGHGLDVSRYDAAYLAKAFAKQMTDGSAANVAAYLQRLAADRAEAEVFLHSLNIGYSEFFRDPLAFAVLEQVVLPSLVKAKEAAGCGEIRVWSAGCAAGQEAWSVAMLLDKLGAARGGGAPYRVIATDVAEAALGLARQGRYEAGMLGNVRARQLRECFSPAGDTYRVLERLRERVDFSAYDLLDDQAGQTGGGEQPAGGKNPQGNW